MLEMVSGRNFRSYEQVKLEFGNRQVSVVCGDSQSDYADSNGTGKTSLMYLVLWTLFGKWPGMESADSCIRQPANKDCCGIVWLTKPDGRYAISRYRKDTIHGTNVFIQPPNHTGAATTAPDIISGDLKVMNERIEGLLGMNYETFVRTMVFTGTEATTFALMTDKEQKALLDTIVPFDFSALHARAKEKWKNAMETEIECNGVSKAIDQWIEKNQVAMMKLDDHRHELIAQNDETMLREKIRTLDEHVAVYKKAVTDARRERMAVLPLLNETIAKIDQYKPTVKAYEDAKERWAMFVSAKETLTRQEKERVDTLAGIDREITKQKNHLREHEQGKVCHTCGQPLGFEALQKAQSSIEQEIKRLGDLRLDAIRRYDHIQTDYLGRQTNSGFNEETAATYKAEYEAAQRHMQVMERAYAEEDRRYRELERRALSNEQQIEKAAAVRADLESALRPDTFGMSKIEEDLTRLAQETERLKADRKASGDNQAKWAEEKALWDNVANMLGGGKGSLQHFLFEALLPEMTATAQMCLSLFSKDQLRVAFKSHRAKGSKTVEGFYIEASKGEQTNGYGDLSGGERRRIDFCIFLTLHLMAAKHVFGTGVLFLDEIADFMDDTGQQSVVSVLEFFCQQYGVSCLLLTNKRELVASVAHGYRCLMADGISALVSVQET